ncbi:hypothetical protein [Aestuariivirga sp.]|uniref:hypothetical protein n=1 Tax=Aestuariivirga sp. TaxID=2650926 RepID=UPI003BAA6607
MRQRPEMLSGKLSIVAGLAAGTAFVALLAATAAVYLAVDALGALLIGAFLLASMALGASGWLYHLRTIPAEYEMPREVAPGPAAAPAQGFLRLLEAVSAEIKSSASTIKGFTGLLETATEAKAAADAHRYLQNASGELCSFAAQFHDYVRFERGRLRLTDQQVDAGELVETALALCRETVEAADTVIVATLAEGVEITCDAERLRQAITSLALWVVNSAAAGGLIEIGIFRLGDGGLSLECRCKALKPIHPQNATAIFEPQPAVNGLRAFALPIARRVALLHSGDVTAACANGSVTAYLTLPPQRVAWPSAETSSARAA